MDRRRRRRGGVGDALAEPIPSLRSGAAAAGSFEAQYRQALPRVYAYVMSLVRDRSVAEEVTAQAFERAYRRRRSFRAARGTPEAWLFGIARNAALDELRRRNRRGQLEADVEDVEAAAPHEEAELAVRRETVRAALRSLPGHDRDIVALKFAGGLSNAEIARVLRISESNAGTRLHRAIERLREACDEAS